MSLRAKKGTLLLSAANGSEGNKYTATLKSTRRPKGVPLPPNGQYLVGPDGTINLRRCGTLQVMGLTIAEAKAALEKHLAKYFHSPEVSVDVIAYNSKVYYVITEGPGSATTSAACRSPATRPCSMPWPRSTGCRKFRANGCGSPALRVQRQRNDPPHRLRGDHSAWGHGDELSDHAGRPALHRRRPPHGKNNQLIKVTSPIERILARFPWGRPPSRTSRRSCPARRIRIRRLALVANCSAVSPHRHFTFTLPLPFGPLPASRPRPARLPNDRGTAGPRLSPAPSSLR